MSPFVRALDSREIFTSPLSYAVVPITVGRDRRRLDVQLEAPAQARPGEPFVIRCKTDRPGRVAVFAVDEGILQVSDYQLPDPLSYFFRQAALLVGTSQIMDLIMPEFSVLRSVSASGGDGDLLRKELNPFQRVTEKPVVFWSGIVDVDSTGREFVYNVPDYFNGTLRVMAVGYATDAVERAEDGPHSHPVCSHAGLAHRGGSWRYLRGRCHRKQRWCARQNITLTAEPSEHLEVIKSPSEPLHLETGKETTAVFTVRATDKLGSGQQLPGIGRWRYVLSQVDLECPAARAVPHRGAQRAVFHADAGCAGFTGPLSGISQSRGLRLSAASGAGARPGCVFEELSSRAVRSRSRARRSAGSCSPMKPTSACRERKSRISSNIHLVCSARGRTTREGSPVGRAGPAVTSSPCTLRISSWRQGRQVSPRHPTCSPQPCAIFARLAGEVSPRYDSGGPYPGLCHLRAHSGRSGDDELRDQPEGHIGRNFGERWKSDITAVYLAERDGPAQTRSPKRRN